MGEYKLMQQPESYGSVKLSRVKAAIKQIEDHYQDCPERLEDVEVTFEYLVGSFFPRIIDNINSRMNDMYTQGYLQGLNDAKENHDEN
jgi:hypothetical protein